MKGASRKIRENNTREPREKEKKVNTIKEESWE